MQEFRCSAKVRRKGQRLRCKKTAVLHYHGYNEHTETFLQFFRCENHPIELALPVFYKFETIEAWVARVMEQKLRYAAQDSRPKSSPWDPEKKRFERKVFEAEAKLLWGTNEEKKTRILSPVHGRRVNWDMAK